MSILNMIHFFTKGDRAHRGLPQRRLERHDEMHLDALLRTREFVEADGDLAHRICLAAAATPRYVQPTLTQPSWFTRTLQAFADTVAPTPAFACLGLLLLGIVLGRETPATQTTTVAEASTTTDSSYDTADNANYGSWGSL